MNVRVLRSGNVTGLRSRAGYQPDCAALARNRIAVARAASGQSPDEFAVTLSQMTGRDVRPGHVISWETTATPPGDILMAADTFTPPGIARLSIRSHKFIAGYAGPQGVGVIGQRDGMTMASPGGLECRTAPVDHPSGECALYAWPYGPVIFHLTEDLDISGVAALALWRVQSYEENLAWATRQLREMTGDGSASASYVLSLYWVHAPVWTGQLLTTALRLICAPRVLLERAPAGDEASMESAEEAERMLLAEGYEHPGMRAFGQHGVSAGFASWSGVSYYPADPQRALAEDDLTGFELAMQSVWAYCEHVTARAEQGLEPDVPEGYGFRFLRGARAALMNPRPTETGGRQAMREAVVETSALPQLLAQALDVLREEGRP
jgi:hypothetical protein